jgi:uncharacterized membrane protein YjjP (DUF1212 family)
MIKSMVGYFLLSASITFLFGGGVKDLWITIIFAVFAGILSEREALSSEIKKLRDEVRSLKENQ